MRVIRKVERFLLLLFVGLTELRAIKVETICFSSFLERIVSVLLIDRCTECVGLHLLVNFIGNNMDLVKYRFEIFLLLL